MSTTTQTAVRNVHAHPLHLTALFPYHPPIPLLTHRRNKRASSLHHGIEHVNARTRTETGRSPRMASHRVTLTKTPLRILRPQRKTPPKKRLLIALGGMDEDNALGRQNSLLDIPWQSTLHILGKSMYRHVLEYLSMLGPG